MYSSFVKHISFPFYQWWHGSDYLKILKEYEKSQWYSPEQLYDLQFQRLQKILIHAYENVPYYKELFADIKITPVDIQSFDDFKKIPTLTKETLQTRLEDLTAKNIPRDQLHQGVTSGSSGQPTYYHQDRNGNRIRKAAGRRLMKMVGYDIGQRVFYFWRESPYTILGGKKVSRSDESLAVPSMLIRAKRSLHNSFAVENQTLQFDPTQLNEEEMHKAYSRLKAFKPHLIVSYVSALYRLAQFFDAEKLTDIRPGSIVVSSETLYQHQRELMEKVFGCPVYNRYGLQETGMVAVECPERTGLHYNQEILYVENVPVTDDNNQLVITDLINVGMPLLRYETGDSASLDDSICECGRGLGRIGQLQGRIIELFPTKLGGHINGQLFATFHWIEGVRQYQVIQREIDKFVIRIVTDDTFKDANLKPMLDVIYEKFGNDAVIQIDNVDNIPFTKGCKYKLVVSEISS